MFGDSDLPLLFADFGVSVIWNAEPSVLGILDTSADVFAHGSGPGGFERSTVMLRIPFNAFSAIPQPLDAITVDGVNYTVHSLPEQRDLRIISPARRKTAQDAGEFRGIVIDRHHLGNFEGARESPAHHEAVLQNV